MTLFRTWSEVFIMKKEKPEGVGMLDFKKQTPKMQIGEAKFDSLYEKAFFSKEEKECEYLRNTATWD